MAVKTIINSQSKVALVHEWLIDRGGAENCLEAFCELYPKADIYTLIYRKETFTNSVISKHTIHTSFLQKIPGIFKLYRNLPMLYPMAIESFNLSKYDLIISIHYSVSHGVKTHDKQLHVSFTCTPARFLWSGYDEYVNDPMLKNPIKKFLAKMIIPFLRRWDLKASKRPDHYIAIAEEIKKRIKKYYNRQGTVIYPPVDTEMFMPKAPVKKGDYYFTISRLVPYKKIDLIAEAFTKMREKKLVIAGKGPELEHIKAISKGCSNIKVLGFISDEERIDLEQKAKAFIFAANEDFGIVPVEAQAAGTPVIAYGKGGALETVIDGKTGVFFKEQSISSLIVAINHFETVSFSRDALLKNADRFSKQNFKRKIHNYIQNKLK